MNQRRARVVVAKPGLDGHERGVQVIARALRDAGMEVIYTGIRQTPESIVAIALQEDADVIGLSMLAGSHVEYSLEVIDELGRQGASDIPVIVGGIIPAEDVAELMRIGVRGVFGPGSSLSAVVDLVGQLTTERPDA